LDELKETLIYSRLRRRKEVPAISTPDKALKTDKPEKTISG
jgi:hypothetical protein